MPNNIVLSVIIPVYNSERFLRECLDSVFARIPANCEVIVVDDGSEDDSARILTTDYSSYLSRGVLRVFHRQNSGPGAARNFGVDQAGGRYISFVDSDDIVLGTFYTAVFRAIERWNPDVVQFNYKRFVRTENVEKLPTLTSHTSNGLFDLSMVREEIFSVGKWFPVTRVYKREIFRSHKFPEMGFYEDARLLPLIFLEDYRIALLDQALYAYRANPAGTTLNHSEAHALTLWTFFLSLSDLPRSAALDIYRVQIARTLSYFSAELDVPFISRRTILEVLRLTRSNLHLKSRLSRADYLFFIAPSLYMLLDRARHLHRHRGRRPVDHRGE